MALIALQSEALESGSRDIELGDTAYNALKRLGLPDGGKVAESALAQLEKLARCHVSFRIGSDLKGLEINERLVEAFEYDTDGKTFIKRVRLSTAFFEGLRRHPVAIDRSAVQRIRNSPVALDVYLWLSYRLPVLERDTPISWSALHKQFGHGIGVMRFFKRPFAENLGTRTVCLSSGKLRTDRSGHNSTSLPAPKAAKGNRRIDRTKCVLGSEPDTPSSTATSPSRMRWRGRFRFRYGITTCTPYVLNRGRTVIESDA